MNKFLLLCLLSAGVGMPAGAANYTFSRYTIPYGSVAVGLTATAGLSISMTADATSVVQSVTINGPGFEFAEGVFPYHLIGKAASFSYAFTFAPTAAKNYNTTATFIIDGQPVDIALTGTGIATTAAIATNYTGLSFSEPQGSLSKTLKVKVTNTGTSTVNILSVTTQPPFSTPPVGAIPLVPGASTQLSVSYFGQNLGSTTGDLLITYDVLKATGISLKGTTSPAPGFVVTNFPSLPLGTAGFPYLAQLTSTAGTGGVSWSLAPGSNLPAGLSLSSSGSISGAIPAGAPLKTYTFTVNAVDSKSHTASATLSLEVLKSSGASCSYISWNVGGTSNPMLPISDLGAGSYFGTEGGLYGNGSNLPPARHDADGVALAQQIQPMDVNGIPDPNGKFALVGIGISTLLYEMQPFVQMAMGDLSTNPHLVVVNGGEPTGNATDFASLSSPFWTTLLNNIIPNAGVTPQQVAVVMFEDIDVFPAGAYPGDMVQLQGEFETVAQNALKQFPNVKLMYYVPRFYSGYSGTVDLASPEPYAYEQGFAIQGALLDQINGSPSLNYNPANGPVMAPWLGYGPYTWANGLIARSDGLTYNCQDVRPDGRHPSALYGAPKIAAQFLNFFKTNDTSAPWFLKPVK